MLKSFFTPLQQWLLQRGQCVGCGMPLVKALKRTVAQKQYFTCKCGRTYLLEGVGTFRRALMSEVSKLPQVK